MFVHICLKRNLCKAQLIHYSKSRIFWWYHQQIFLQDNSSNISYWLAIHMSFKSRDKSLHICLSSRLQIILFHNRLVNHKYSLLNFHTEIKDIKVNTFLFQDFQNTFQEDWDIWKHMFQKCYQHKIHYCIKVHIFLGDLLVHHNILN